MKNVYQCLFFFCSIDYSMINFLFVDSQQNESLSGLFSIDSQGFIHTLVSFDREFQSNYSLYISMYDLILKYWMKMIIYHMNHFFQIHRFCQLNKSIIMKQLFMNLNLLIMMMDSMDLFQLNV
jgi:hypothetical protein